MRNQLVNLRQASLILVLLGSFFHPAFTFARPSSIKHRVVVLHSFHKGQKWNDDLSKGIASILKTNEIELNFEFMDTIRNHGTSHTQNLTQLYQNKYSKRQVDLVISTDEQALDYLLAHRENLFPGASVVFCGIKSYKKKIREARLTGVIEAVDIRSNVVLAMDFNPDLKTIFVVSDNTPASITLILPLIQVMKEFSSEIEFKFNEFLPIEDLQNTLKNLAPDTAVLLINYTRDKNGRILSMDESARLITSSSPVPVYTLWDSYMGMGILGGKLVSGFTQGEAAAKIALMVLNGESTEEIHVQSSLPSQYIFDYQKLKQFKIKDSKVPVNSQIYNLPRTFYRQYKNLIITVTIGGVLLSLIIVVLSINMMHRRRVEKALKKYSSQLDYLHRLDQSILNNFSLENISDNIMGPSLWLFNCRLIGIFLLGTEAIPARGLVRIEKDRNKIIKDLIIEKRHLPMEMLRKGEIVHLRQTDAGTTEFLFKEEDYNAFDSYLLFPLMFQDHLLGILFLGNSNGKGFDYDTESTCRQVADSLAMAVQNDYFLAEIKGHREELRQMSLNILKAQEKERKLLSAELHDEFGQTLTAIGLNLSVIRKKLDKPQPINIKHHLKEVEQAIELLSEQVHDLSLDLRPPMLDDLGLVPTLRWYLNQFKDRSGLSVDMSVSAEEEKVIPNPVSVTMYRVMQEALNNITKHANATRVSLQLSITPVEVKLTISDDGIGFNYYKVMFLNSGQQALGLIGMRERLELLNGSLEINTVQDKGTTLTAVSPV